MYLYGNSEKYLTDKNLNIGVRNYVLDSAKSVSITGTGRDNDTLSINSISKPLKQFTSKELSHVILSFNWAVSDGASGSVEIQFNDTPWDLDGQILKIDFSNAKSGRFCKKFNLATKQYYGGSNKATGLAIKQDGFTGTFTVDHIKLEIGDVPTQWCPAPEDLVAKSDFDQKVNIDNQIGNDPNNSLPASDNWSDIFGVNTGTTWTDRHNLLRVSQTQETNYFYGKNSSAIFFGSGDTKGGLEVHYNDHEARIVGGNNPKVLWFESIAWKSDIANLNQLLAPILPSNTEQLGNTDLNNLPSGWCIVTDSSSPNFPPNENNKWAICFTLYVSENNRLQICIPYDASGCNIYIRTCGGEPVQWSTWKKIAYSA